MNVKIKLPGYAGAIAAIIVIAALNSLPAAAQETQAEDTNRLRIEEIVVTTRRKEENLQDVPLAITAFSADQIEAAGITNLDDVAAFTPGLTFTNLFGEFLAVPVIRGIAPTAIFRENNAAIFIDGVFVSGREGLNASQLDLERIEIVKGPQSTKYGRNAFSGAINMITARPTDQLEGKADVTVGSDERRSARVSVGGPLIGSALLGRVAVGIDEWVGSYNNNYSRADIGGYTFKTLQSSLWWTPVDTLDIQWAVYLSDDEIGWSPLQSVAANCEDRFDLHGIAPELIDDPENPGSKKVNPDHTVTTRPQNYCGTIQSLPDNTMGASAGATGEERELIRSSINMDWDVGFGTFLSLTGFSNTKQTGVADGAQDPGYVPFTYQTTSGGTGSFLAEELTVSGTDETTEWSQELRFRSNQDRRFRYDLGAYYYDVALTSQDTDVIARLAGDSGLRLPADFEAFWPLVVGDAIWLENTHPCDETLPDVPSWFLQTRDDISKQVLAANDENSWSVFTGAELDIGKRWIFDAGVRYTDTEKEITQFTNCRELPKELAVNDTDSWDYTTWRVGATFHLNDALMFYTSVATGAKAGGFDTVTVNLVPTDGSPLIQNVTRVFRYDIEKNTTIEFGNKGTFDRWQYDLAIFYTDWTDILLPQIIEVDPETGLAFDLPEGVDQTGGDATVYGIETSMRFLLSENWSTSLGGSWTIATFDEGDVSSYRLFPSFWTDTDGNGQGDKGDIAGKDVLRQSAVQGNATLEYRRPMGGDWDWFTRGDVLYQSSQWVGSANQAKIPARVYVNLRFGFDSERYQLEFWVQNLLDDDTPVAAFRDVFFNNTHDGVSPSKLRGDLFPFRLTVRHPNRRRYGLTARVRF